MTKRLFDIILSFVALLLASPLLLIISLAIKIDSPGPILFRQERVGLHGKPFKILKFRSMVDNAALKGPYFTKAGDPRITRVGRILRKLSLDELPQLVNVLIGEMSLVGPRPDVMEQIDLYTSSDWKKRLRVRPGITGLAQVMGRSSLDFESRTAFDLEYVDAHNALNDISILCKTLMKIGRDKGN